MSSAPEASEIAKFFHQFLTTKAHQAVSDHFSHLGKSIRTQKGEFRVDYTKAVHSKLNEYYAVGITESGLFSFIYENYPQLTRAQLDAVVKEFVNQQSAVSRKAVAAILTDGITPEAFLQAAKNITGDLVGVYIIYNQTKDMYYVGQAKRLYFRVKQHFTGHGNGDVYADYKYGDAFLIRLITLRESGYDDLDRLERDMIAKYRAYERGYNKTAGNQS
jgi:hypothetical protein